ncbi:E3 ubiquitin-protein ligase BOI-like isoform X1 [Punica granatum]|nr:E3 ubiquitin-protein ligase BOI-like isoform X1 [Punica granatum]OWM90499.1 hypothetical protein CDL15_Pgr014802 [Punica granatum]
MFGGDSSNPGFPLLLGDSQFQYDANVMPQLQLFGDYTVGGNVGHLNYLGKNHTVNIGQPAKRFKEAEPISRQRNLINQSDKLFQHEAGNSGSIFNPQPVSTGLKLAYEEDEHNSSISSVSEGMTATLPTILSLNNNFKSEMDRQKEELDQYIRLQEEGIVKGVRELQRRHTASLLSAIEKGVGKKLHEKDLEIENMNRKNKELEERVKQVTMEVQSWHYRAKYNESVINVLKNNLQQVAAQGAMNSKEGCGDSEVDDAASYVNRNPLNLMDGSGTSVSGKTNKMSCRACKVKEVSVLFLPCRHLCLCKDCEGFIDLCPVCQVMKTASVQVYLS